MMSIVYFGTLAASLVRNDQGSAFPSSQMDSVGSNVSRAVLHIYDNLVNILRLLGNRISCVYTSYLILTLTITGSWNKENVTAASSFLNDNSPAFCAISAKATAHPPPESELTLSG
eukprot:scaffold1949_cov175-Skeletonema_menzelii.AAC.1